MEKVDFNFLFDSYFAENELEKRTLTNYRAVQHKLNMFDKNTGRDINLADFDIMGIPVEQRRERIKAFQDYVKAFMTWLKDFHKLGTVTRRLYIRTIRMIVNYARRDFGIELTMPKEKREAAQFAKLKIPDNVVRHILTMNPGRHHGVLIAKLALYTCWRISDLLEICTSDLKDGEFMGQPCTWVMRMTKKTKKVMQTPVPRKLVREIMRRYHVSPGEKLLKHPTGLVLTEARCVELVRAMLNSDQFLRRTTIQGTNIEGETIEIPLWKVHRPMHLFRSAGASYLVQRGMTPESVARWFTGHENRRVLQDYYITSDDFTGAKELFKERFILPHISDGDKLQEIFDNYDEPKKIKGRWPTS